MGKKQPEHTRVIKGRRVLVNEGVPGKQSGAVAGVGRPATPPPVEPDGDPTLGGYDDSGAHLTDLVAYGMDVAFVPDDDGGGLVFNAASYPVAGSGSLSVLDAVGEDAAEERISLLARSVGLGGAEILGNARQWIKVYDSEGHPLAQDGYVPDGTVDKLVEFQRLLEEGDSDQQ